MPSSNDVREKSVLIGSQHRSVRPSSAKPEPKKSKPKTAGTKRTKKGDGLANGTITGRATKASATRTLKPTKEASKELLNLRSEESPISFKEPRSIALEWENEPLQLEAATKRRSDWTPIKDTAISSIDLTANPGSSPASILGNGSQRFTSLLSDYAFIKDPISVSDTGYREQAPTKKRRLEVSQWPFKLNIIHSGPTNQAFSSTKGTGIASHLKPVQVNLWRKVVHNRMPPKGNVLAKPQRLQSHLSPWLSMDSGLPLPRQAF